MSIEISEGKQDVKAFMPLLSVRKDKKPGRIKTNKLEMVSDGTERNFT